VAEAEEAPWAGNEAMESLYVEDLEAVEVSEAMEPTTETVILVVIGPSCIVYLYIKC
jgi:hypothetical protein